MFIQTSLSLLLVVKLIYFQCNYHYLVADNVSNTIDYNDIIYQGIQLPASSVDEEASMNENPFKDINRKVLTLLVYSGWTDWSPCPNIGGLMTACVTEESFNRKSYIITHQKRERICRQTDVVLSQSNVEPCYQIEDIQRDIRDCPAPPICPPSINGGWSEWSEWSECSLKCQHPDNMYERRNTEKKISTGWQTRSRSCNNPPPRYGGQPCYGIDQERQMCTNETVPFCPIDGSWTPWQPLKVCDPIVNIKEDLPENHEWHESMNTIEPGMRCTPGLLLLERRCSAPHPQNGGQKCRLTNSTSERPFYGLVELQKSHCWIQEACQASEYSVNNLDPPQDCSFRSVGHDRVDIHWRRQSYGRIPNFFLLTWLNQRTNEFDQRLVMVNDRRLDSWGEVYHETVTSLRNGHEYTFEVSAMIDEKDRIQAKQPTCIVNVLVGRVDGQWSAWSDWDECSSACVDRRGVQNRHRTCVFNSPLNKGRDCVGRSEIERICYGNNYSC